MQRISFSTPVIPTRLISNTDLANASKAAQALQPHDSAVIGVSSAISTPFELFGVGSAAFGFGQVATGFKIVGGISVAIGTYQSIRGLVTSITPEQVDAVLKPLNHGNDISSDDAKMLAANMTKRQKITSAIGLVDNAVSGAALVTGGLAMGVGAFALKFISFGASVYTGLETAKDIVNVLAHQAPAPAPGPAPTPAPVPTPAPAPSSPMTASLVFA